MRVATISIYKQATYQLGRITSDLNDANEVVHTNLRINSASDDPSGMNQVLNINSTMAALNQYQVNVDHAQNVLTTAETALDAMADQLSEMKLLCSSMANASASARQRINAAENMHVYLDSLLDLANSHTYSGYVFGGDDNQTTPFTCDNDDNPTSVIYNGSSDAVRTRTSENTSLSLDFCGCDLFYEDEIVVDTTNNRIVFTEDPGKGKNSILTMEARITSGTYSKEGLADVVEDTLNEASEKYGYDIVYNVAYDKGTNTFSIGTDGNSKDKPMTVTFEAVQTETVRISNFKSDGKDFDNVEIDIANKTVMTRYTPKPEGTKPLTFTYTQDDFWEVSNDPGYMLPSKIKATGDTLKIDVNDDGETDVVIDLNKKPAKGDTISFDIVKGYENACLLPDLGFEDETVTLETVTSDGSVADNFVVVAGKNDAIDFTETLLDGGGTSVQLTAVIAAGNYANPESYAEAVEEALEAASAKSGNRANYLVAYDKETDAFTISEDTGTGRQLESFNLLFFSGTNTDSSAARNLGFEIADISSGPVQGGGASWSIWDTVFDFKKALETSDVDGIQRAMTRLGNHYESITSHISSIGRIYDSTTTTEAVISSSDSTLTTRLSTVRDADTVKAIMNLKSTQTVYQAALSSTSTVMGLSLVNYMK